MVTAQWGTGGTNPYTGVSYGGTSLSLIAAVASDNQTSGGVALYGVVSNSLPTGANNVVISGGNSSLQWSGAGSYSGAGSLSAGNTAFGVATTGTGNSISVPSTTTGGRVVSTTCFGGQGITAFTATSPATKRWQNLASNASGSGTGMLEDEASVGGGSATAIAWTSDGSDWFGQVAVEIIPPGTATPAPWDPPRYPQRTIIPMYSTPRRRQTADVPLITKNAFVFEPPRYPQNFTKAEMLRRVRQGVAPTGWPVPVQPSTIPATGEHRYSKPLLPRKAVVAPTGLPVPVQPPKASEQVRQRFTRVLFFRRGNVATTGWPVPSQPPNIPNALRFIGPRRRFLRPGVVAPTNLPEPKQIPYSTRQRWTRFRFLRSGGVVPPTGWPVTVQPPERMQAVHRGSRPLFPRRGTVRTVAPPPVLTNPPISWFERRWSRPPWSRRGIVAPTGLPVPVQPPEIPRFLRRWSRPPSPRHGIIPLAGLGSPPIANLPISFSERRFSRPPWTRRGNPQPNSGLPVPVQPPERIQSVRRFSRPPWPRRGTTINAAPPPVVVNPPISWSERRWSRPPWPRKDVTPPTGWPVPVQPTELPHSVRRWTRILLPRKGVVAPSVTPPPVLLTPFAQVAERHTPKPVVRYARTVQALVGIPGPVPSVERPNRFRRISGPRRAAPGVLQPPLQSPYLPTAIRRENKLRRFRRGNVQPNTGWPVPVQPPERMQFIRRRIKPLFPRRGVVPPSAPPPVIIIEVKLPVWCWITIAVPDVAISNQLPFTWITVSIPLVNEEEV